VVLIAGVLALGFSSTRTIRETNDLVLRNITVAADLRLGTTVAAFQQLIDSSEALRLFFIDRTNDPWHVKEAQDALNRMVSSDDLVHSVYLVRLSDLTVVHDEYRFPLDGFPDRAFVDDALRDRLVAPQWERQRLLGPLYKPGGPRWTVPVAQGYPNPRVLGGLGLAVLNLDLGEFRSMLQTQIPEGATGLVVLDREGNDVARVGSPAGREWRLRYEVASDLTGWSFVAEFDTAELGWVVGGAATVWTIYAIVMSSWALAGIVLFSRIVRRHQVAVSRVTGMIRRFVAEDRPSDTGAIDLSDRSQSRQRVPLDAEQDDNEALERQVRSILQQLSAARSLEAEQMRLRRRVLVEDLILRPDAPTQDQVLARVEEAGIDPDIQSVLVVMVALSSELPVSRDSVDTELAAWHGAMERLISSVLSDQSHLSLGYWYDFQTIALLCLDYGSDDDAVGRITRLLKDLQAQVRAELSTSFVASVSDARTGWTDVPQASREARFILEYRHFLGPGSIATQSDLLSFRANVHDHLLAAASEFAEAYLRSDDQWQQKGHELMTAMVRDVPVRSEQVAMLRHLLYVIYDGLLELSTDYRERYYELVIREFPMLAHNEHEDALAGSTIKLLVRYHRAMTELDSRSRHSDLATTIVQTVRERLTDADLSLKGLASQFNTSISTVSRLFQEVEGVGFASFLSRERMVIAKRLLSETEEDIADVCTSVGYSNYAAFARAFKREVGLSPGRFRARTS
jgi:AraC-like DNA-binding protein